MLPSVPDRAIRTPLAGQPRQFRPDAARLVCAALLLALGMLVFRLAQVF